MKGYVHSLQSLGTVDGPGVRSVVFLEGCPLRCVYCQNPDTWECDEAHLTEAEDLVKRLIRFTPFIKNGGVTFSGGEPCLQADFVYEVACALRKRGLHVALDTSGCVWNEAVERLLEKVDLVLLDIKVLREEEYRKCTGGSLADTLFFLNKLEEMQKDTWIRHVVVPDISRGEEDMEALARLVREHSCVKKVELLPFRKLCIEKYEMLGLPFALKDAPTPSEEDMRRLEKLLDGYLQKT